MVNNYVLFNECLEHKVNNIDYSARYILNKVIIPKKNDKNNLLLNKNDELVELLIQYNNYKKLNDISHDEEIILKIDDCLKFDGMNFSPFSQYLMIHDITYNMYLEELSFDEKKYIIDSYLEDRHEMYMNYAYSEIVFQVLNDNYSHKRKSVLGVEKLKKICEKYNIKKLSDNITDDIYYILPDSGDRNQFKEILKKNNIKFSFANNHQDKMPDLLIKFYDSFIIVEHKKIKELGGGQDKQMTEIIDFIKYDERGIYYVSYLDGILFNELKNPKETNKIYRDKIDILNSLKENPYNYFVNEFGFLKLIDSFFEERKRQIAIKKELEWIIKDLH